MPAAREQGKRIIMAWTRKTSIIAAAGAAVVGLAEAVEFFAALRRALALALGSPAIALSFALCLALAAGGFRLLHDILQRERSWSYVDPI